MGKPEAGAPLALALALPRVRGSARLKGARVFPGGGGGRGLRGGGLQAETHFGGNAGGLRPGCARSREGSPALEPRLGKWVGSGLGAAQRGRFGERQPSLCAAPGSALGSSRPPACRLRMDSRGDRGAEGQKRIPFCFIPAGRALA